MIAPAALSLFALACNAVTCALTHRNLKLFQAPKIPNSPSSQPLSILIPARNEEKNIQSLLHSILSQSGVEFEILILDDHSEDRTADLVSTIAATDPRVKLHHSQALPPHWCGKQWACFQLAQLAHFDHFLFLDADVQLAPNCLSAVIEHQATSRVSLLSGFPRQITNTPFEWLLLPLMHVILLGFLPFDRMRNSLSPAASAGCGQFFLATRHAYFACGGHSAIAQSAHDGIQLPRLFRRFGFSTDLCDITSFAHVRMYESATQVWLGLTKNATEGVGHPRTIVPMSLLLSAQLLPFVLWLFSCSFWVIAPSIMSITLLLISRLLLRSRFKHPLKSVICHPIGLSLFLLLQWISLTKSILGIKTMWKGRLT